MNIWSDWAPKQFKISSNIKLLLNLEQARPYRMWSYNFFPSYHECSVCDAAASHIKKKMIWEQRDKQKAVQTLQQVVEVKNQLNNHEVSMAAVTSTKLMSNTLKGIKQFHKFTTSTEKNVIYAISNSIQSKHVHNYCPRDVVPLDDLIIWYNIVNNINLMVFQFELTITFPDLRSDVRYRINIVDNLLSEIISP